MLEQRVKPRFSSNGASCGKTVDLGKKAALIVGVCGAWERGGAGV